MKILSYAVWSEGIKPLHPTAEIVRLFNENDDNWDWGLPRYNEDDVLVAVICGITGATEYYTLNQVAKDGWFK